MFLDIQPYWFKTMYNTPIDVCMGERHFFSEAASISWISWLMRQLPGRTPIEPTLLVSDFDTKEPPRPPTGLTIRPINQQAVAQYTQFLKEYFYSKNEPYELVIPPGILYQGIQSGFILGVEARDTRGTLVGCVFDLFLGTYSGKDMGLTTWMCVHPMIRRTGLGTCLLFSICSETKHSRKAHWWRNDGWLKSSSPPIYTQTKIQRKKQLVRTNTVSKSLQISRSSMAHWKDHCIQQWRTENPTGLVLEGKEWLVEVFDCKVSNTVKLAVFCCPTFEREKATNKTRCEVIAWCWSTPPKTAYEQAHFLESMIDQLPYDWIEAPTTIPHLDTGWTPIASVVWSAINFDSGIPVWRPLLPLCSA
jgi:hypothetical protein